MTIQQDISLLADPSLLDKIDRLRDLSIGRHVALPQLVVGGDQSSGKSSLLYSLTGMPFLRDQTLCTRYVTQIRSRRADTESVKISITPGPNASEEHRKCLEDFKATAASNFELRLDFPDIMKRAYDAMGLRANLSDLSGSTFSEDILTVDIRGPEEDLLTIIDVPGIFRTTGEGTTKKDIEMVNAIVRNYIKDERTIILGVLPANVDVATQEILQHAKEYDPNGKRTIGVLTKPDLVTEADAQAVVCDLIEGNKRPLKLGYYLVQNLGTGEEHPESEQSLSRPPWNRLPSDRVGIPALKDQLQTVLGDLSRREFPLLIADLNLKHKDASDELERLGPSRQNNREQRIFLGQIARHFQDALRAALVADYSTNTVFDKNENRLVTQVVNLTESFADDFRVYAHSRHFDKAEVPIEATVPKPIPNGFLSAVTSQEDVPKFCHPDHRDSKTPDKLDSMSDQEHAELGNIISLRPKAEEPCGNITEWIRNIYHQSRGLDLGTFSSHLVSTAFAEQSRKWESMTKAYMSKVVLTIHRFLQDILASVCSDSVTREGIWTEILGGLVASYKTAFEQVNMLIYINQQGRPWTFNEQFNQRLTKARAQRTADLLRPQARQDTKQYGEPQYMVNIDDIPRVVTSQSNAEYLQEEVHDILQAYYNLALERYVDNVFQLGVEHHLLSGARSPLKIFTPDWVLELESKKLERIAGESKGTKKARDKIKQKLSDLEKALQVLKEQ